MTVDPTTPAPAPGITSTRDPRGLNGLPSSLLAPKWSEAEDAEFLRLIAKPANHNPNGYPNWPMIKTDIEYMQGLGKIRTISSLTQHYNKTMRGNVDRIKRRAERQERKALEKASTGKPAATTAQPAPEPESEPRNVPSFCPHCGKPLLAVIAAMNL